MTQKEPRRTYSVTDSGWLTPARHSPSPNFSERPEKAEVDLLVIHNISLPPCEYGGPYIEDLFLNRLDCGAHPYFDRLRNLQVSSHFLIRRDGSLIQFVSANHAAWHAGKSVFQNRERCNDFSIGIEMEGSDYEAFTTSQYTVLSELSAALIHHYAVRSITGHEHIAPGRKTDPGPFFDWHFYKQSLATVSAASGGEAAWQVVTVKQSSELP